MRVVLLSALALGVGAVGALLAEVLLDLIALMTNLAFYHRVSTKFVPPATDAGAWLLVIPVVGALIVGLMARFGSRAIRGHGIPEVMENILEGGSRIPARLMFLKPLSAAVAIGTGGPFGAEGPIIATGGAFGSTIGQWLHVTADERKILLAAGAAAGMAATFGSPVAAVLLAVELLLFEYRPRSIIPVALASSAATAVRFVLLGSQPAFAVPTLVPPTEAALAAYIGIGLLTGLLAVGVTRVVYGIEDAFERLPIHWMWWPALGALVVGIVGLIEPRVLGVGYQYIEQITSGSIAGRALVLLIVLKFVAWSIYLGSGTSGGTLAPLFIIGGGFGAALAGGLQHFAPELGVQTPVAAIVGMAAIFAGASHALLASVIFAFETTRQPMGLLPLLAGCSAAYLVSVLLSPHSIMTEKLARRGKRVTTQYAADHLSQVIVADAATREVVVFQSDDLLEEIREELRSGGLTHQGFPVLNDAGDLVGVITRRDVFAGAADGRRVADVIKRAPAVVYEDNTLREAADHMIREGVGRLPVVDRALPTRVTGIISRSDLLAAHEERLAAATEVEEGKIARLHPRLINTRSRA